MGRGVIGHADFVGIEVAHGALTDGGGAGSALIVASRRDDGVVILSGGLGIGGLGIVGIARSDVLLILLILVIVGIKRCLERSALCDRCGRRVGQLAL